MSDRRVRIYEVGPRDGLQNEATPIPTADQAPLHRAPGRRRPARDRGDELRLAAGRSPSSPTPTTCLRVLPARAGRPLSGPRPEPARPRPGRGGRRGRHRRLHRGDRSAFTERNIGMTVDESLAAFAPVLARAARARLVAPGLRLDGVRLSVHRARRSGGRRRRSARRLLDLGADEICFGDTIGVGVPDQVATLTEAAVAAGIPLERIAYHFHDTRGTALANVAAGLAAGIRCFDSADRRDGRLPIRPGRGRQPRDRGPRVLPRRVGLGARRPISTASWRPPGSSPAPWAGRSRRRSARPAAGTPATGRAADPGAPRRRPPRR